MADPGVCFVGRVAEYLKSGFRMRLITPSAEWVPDRTLFRYAAITASTSRGNTRQRWRRWPRWTRTHP
jgi:hypothetical protein